MLWHIEYLICFKAVEPLFMVPHRLPTLHCTQSFSYGTFQAAVPCQASWNYKSLLSSLKDTLSALLLNIRHSSNNDHYEGRNKQSPTFSLSPFNPF